MIAAGDSGGRVYELQLHAYEFGPAIVTPIKLYNFKTKSFNKEFSVNCQWCGAHFPLDDEMLWQAVSGRIHIDNNWTAAKSAGIVTGNGIYSDPYVIEGLVIDAGGSGNGILIENSNVYIKIENCTVYNSGDDWVSGDAGIRLYNIGNGKLTDNDCSSNTYGIYLYGSSDNNTVSGNNASYNTYYGIYIRSSDYNNISGNTANSNSYGIYIRSSDYNNISGNTANNNSRGIHLYSSNNNDLSGNTANNNFHGGIYLDSSNNNTLSGNIMNEGGLEIFSWDIEELRSHDIDTTNLVNGKPLYYYTNEVNLGPNNFTNAGQVILVNCFDSSISNLTTSYGNTGISLYYCNNNNIAGNIANNNNLNGIRLSYSDNNIISGNNASYNTYYAIRLSYSDNNIISGNIASYNDYGIHLFSSNNNDLSGNTVNYNRDSGIYLDSGFNNNVSGNTARNNEYGIWLSYSDYNDISGNNASYNTYYGIYLFYSDNNSIVINTINNNLVGIYLHNSRYNEVLNNSFSGNGEDIREIRDLYGPQIPPEIVIILVILIGIAVIMTGMIIIKRRLSRDKVISDEESGAIEITDEGMKSLIYNSVTLLIIGGILSLVSYLRLYALVYPISYVGVIIGIIGLVGIIAYKRNPEKMKKYYYLSRAMQWIGWTLFIVFYFGTYILFL